MGPRLAAFIVAVLAALSLSASEIDVTLTVPWCDNHGTTPVLVSIDASRLAADADIELSAKMNATSARRTVRVAAGAQVRTWLLLPNSRYQYDRSVEVAWSGAGGGMVTGRINWDYEEVDLAIIDARESLPLPGIRTALVDGLGAQSSYRVADGGKYSADKRVQRLALDSLPDRWQGIPLGLALLVADEVPAELTAAQRQALALWTRAGGRLFADAATVARFKVMGITATAWSLGAAASEPAAAAAAAVGAGDPLLAALRSQISRVGENARPYPVPGTLGVPTALFIAIAIAFALVVGPVNLWWVRQRRNLALFLITTPLISAAACVILVVTGILAEGLDLRRSAVQIAWLDGEARSAVVWTGVSYFAGLTASVQELGGDDLVVDLGTEARGLPERSFDWLPAGLAATRSWIPGRTQVQLAFAQQRAEPRRVRIEANGAAWRIFNGLGATITHGEWTAPDGTVLVVRDLADGAAAVLLEQASARDFGGAGRFPGAIEALATRPRQPGSFRAQLDRPFLALPGPAGTDAEPVRAIVHAFIAPERR